LEGHPFFSTAIGTKRVQNERVKRQALAAVARGDNF
jgi:hypothetical protein